MCDKVKRCECDSPNEVHACKDPALQPHPYLCVEHGGSPACEEHNREHGFVCPKCGEPVHEDLDFKCTANELHRFDKAAAECRQWLTKNLGNSAQLTLTVVCEGGRISYLQKDFSDFVGSTLATPPLSPQGE